MNQYKTMPDEYLKAVYVPDIYQKSIYSVDYKQLREAGIKLISFDIDDTIVPIEKHSPTKSAITLFENLRLMGFELILFSNANNERTERFGEILGTDYISRAPKPHVINFTEICKRYKEKHNQKIKPDEIAHIGNNIIKDIAAGNTFGITTCFVRNVGKLPKIGRNLKPHKTEGQLLRKVLLERGIWRKHHLNKENDQYYQLNDTPLAQNTI